RAAVNGADIFLMFGDDVVTFGELKSQIEIRAAALHQYGVRPGDRVGLMLPTVPEHIYLFFALVWVGALSVPISVHLKAMGIGTQLASAEPRLIIADGSYGELATALATNTSVESVIWRGGVPTSET